MSPPQGTKDPGNEDVSEDGAYENIKRELSNKLQVAGFRLPLAGQDFIHAQQECKSLFFL